MNKIKMITSKIPAIRLFMISKVAKGTDTSSVVLANVEILDVAELVVVVGFGTTSTKNFPVTLYPYLKEKKNLHVLMKKIRFYRH